MNNIELMKMIIFTYVFMIDCERKFLTWPWPTHNVLYRRIKHRFLLANRMKRLLIG